MFESKRRLRMWVNEQRQNLESANRHWGECIQRRNELRDEVEALEKKVEKLSARRDMWRTKYEGARAEADERGKDAAGHLWDLAGKSLEIERLTAELNETTEERARWLTGALAERDTFIAERTRLADELEAVRAGLLKEELAANGWKEEAVNLSRQVEALIADGAKLADQLRELRKEPEIMAMRLTFTNGERRIISGCVDVQTYEDDDGAMWRTALNRYGASLGAFQNIVGIEPVYAKPRPDKKAAKTTATKKAKR